MFNICALKLLPGLFQTYKTEGDGDRSAPAFLLKAYEAIFLCIFVKESLNSGFNVAFSFLQTFLHYYFSRRQMHSWGRCRESLYSFKSLWSGVIKTAQP